MNLDSFRMFSLMHLVVVAAFASVMFGLLGAGRRTDDRGRDRLRLRLGWMALAAQLTHNTYWMIFRAGDVNQWPLHLCDIAGFAVVFAFFWPTRLARTLLYFWGGSLSSLAFVIPVLTAGPGGFEFWSFWISHAIVVGGALYLVFVEGYRPRTRDLVLAYCVTLGYGLVTVAINIRLGSNYMYTGEVPLPVPGLPEIGWPFPRLPILAVALFCLISIAYLPWLFVPRRMRPEENG